MTLLERAEAFADDFLFPTANEVDALDVLPRARLDRIAEEGWYGFAGPDFGVTDFAEVPRVIAAFASGCMTTTLVWVQHHGVVRNVIGGPDHLRDELLARLLTGELRATVAFAGLLPGAPLRARPDGDSWVLDGVAKFVSGWGLTDIVGVATRTPDDDVLWLLIDPVAPGLEATPHRLLGVNASNTVTLQFDGVRVDADRETGRFPWSVWPELDAAGLRLNGSYAVGIASRCCRLMGPSPLDDELVELVAALDAGTPVTMPSARARIAAFAVRTAAALIAHQGSGSLDRDGHAERLYREAAVVEVLATRPSIRAELLSALGATR